MAARKSSRKTDAAPPLTKKPGQGGGAASEMGAEDESPSEASRSIDKHGSSAKGGSKTAQRSRTR